MKHLFENLQKLGRALMLPIAVLPVAGLLLRLGQADLLDVPMIAAAGTAIFSHLGLLFAVGVAVGLARDNNGAAGLAALVGYFVTTQGAATLLDVPADVLAGLSDELRGLAADAFRERQLAKLSVPAGILSGVVAGWLYNRYSNIRLPDYLAFFGGRRFVPIASGVAGLAGAAAFGLGWPVLESGMDAMSRSILDAGEVGLFLYGTINRILIVTGLHHIANNIAWFLLGDYNGVTGDLNRFFAGDPTAGVFMSGFFPVMMFGLPAACLAMYQAARPERRRAVGGLLFSMALTSFLTGVTEPVEFTFMFLAPLLYLIHALLTGTAMMLMDILGVRLGFGFSAGLFDYLLNFNIATRPLWLLPVGAVWFVVYYGLFRFFIARFNLPTPGREAGSADGAASVAPPLHDISGLIAALGGAGNLATVDACTTRLRLIVADPDIVDVDALKKHGAHGVVRPSRNALQVVLGPVADQVATDIRALQAASAGGRASPPPTDEIPPVAAPGEMPGGARSALEKALGGEANVRAMEVRGGRLRIEVYERQRVDDGALASVAGRAIAWVSDRVAHVLLADEPREAGLVSIREQP